MTLMEILIVLIILSAVALFSVPSYLNSLKTARENAMVQNMIRIRQGLKVYYAKHGYYPFTDDSTVTEYSPDEELGIYSVNTNHINYYCQDDSISNQEFVCIGVNIPENYQLRMDSDYCSQYPYYLSGDAPPTCKARHPSGAGQNDLPTDDFCCQPR